MWFTQVCWIGTWMNRAARLKEGECVWVKGEVLSEVGKGARSYEYNE